MREKRSRPTKENNDGGGGQSSSSRLPETIILDYETWAVRPPNITKLDPYDEYAGKDELFTIAMHHGGIFHNNLYVQGRLGYIDDCRTNAFNLFELSSIMVALRYSRQFICEWYYCDPVNNMLCVGKQIGHPIHPLIDEVHMERFLSLVGGQHKLVHVYCLEVTHVEAMVRHQEDQDEYLKEFFTIKNSAVVIEEIEEAEAPRTKPIPQPKRKAKPLLLGWYERDVEFEEFLQTSLEENRKKRKKLGEDGRSADAAENLIGRFNIADGGGTTVDEEVVANAAVVREGVVHEVVAEKDICEVIVEDVDGGGTTVDEEIIANAIIVEEEVVHGVFAEKDIDEVVVDEVVSEVVGETIVEEFIVEELLDEVFYHLSIIT
ncbi:hypothetical protein AAHA92_17059 [Salvia divinorum]|uniref:PB1-like domain-containing protein n=1 Tax=Salvia divinorum TaxID=28513 RepID=A0ABD1GXJ0_SALDI